MHCENLKLNNKLVVSLISLHCTHSMNYETRLSAYEGLCSFVLIR